MPIPAINHYYTAIILTVVLTAGLGVFILVRGWRQPTTRWFGIYTTLICVWASGWFMMISSDISWKSLFWSRFLLIPASFIPPTFLHFTQHLLNLTQNRKQILLRRAYYFCGACFSLLAFHPVFVPTVSPIFDFKFYSETGPIYHVFTIWFFMVVTIIFSLLVTGYRSQLGAKKTQVAYILFAYLFAYLGGMMVFFPGYRISLPKFALYGIPITHFVLFYAIVKHRLMGVRILVRRASLIALIYFGLAASAFPLLALMNQKISFLEARSISLFSIEVLIMSGILSLGPFLYAYFIRRSSYFHEHAAAGLTHELKSPLAAIQSALEFMKERAKEKKFDPKQAEYVDLIERNSSRLSAFVNELLQIFNLQNKRKPLSDDQVDMGLLCRSVIQTYEPLAKFKGTSIEFVSVQEPIVISCDRQKIEYIISNLLSNSVKFTLQGRIALSLIQKNSEVTISVHDTGLGISPQDLPHVFEAFFQGEDTRTVKGSGIGLTIAKTWVEAHGGHIWAESKGEGKGTDVTFTLPI